MEDEELQAIRRARMAQLRQQGGPSSGGAGPSSSLLSQLGAGGQGGRRGGEDDDDGAGGGASEEQKMAQMEEQKRQMLSTILDAEARERLSRISLVKPQKAQGITNLLIQMAQSGQIRSRINEAQLIGLLEQVEASSGDGAGDRGSKITYSRKKAALLDDDDDVDL
ncbi:unnamed protein product [Parajaminaea phylloscopi]